MNTWAVGIDIGGTFTDIVAVNLQSGVSKYLKVSSTRSRPAAAVLNGIGALRDEAGIDPRDIRLILHGTTLATNAIIERTLAKTALVTTKGFGDVLELGRTWREELYNPFYEQKEPIVPRDRRFELDQRTGADGSTIKTLERTDIEDVAEELRRSGAEAVAVTLLQSYNNPDDEAAVERELRAILDSKVALSVSSTLMREVREYERTATTVLNASLMPIVKDYLDELERGLAEVGTVASLYISQSNGGMQPPSMARERPVTLALSGPVAGVVALSGLAARLDLPNLIGLDVGGTSADVSLVTDFEPRITAELSIGELPIRLPSVKVDAIGAGGGSIVNVQNGVLRVGPSSAGSDPGPVAYGKGGTEPTVTDCHLVLGRFASDQQLAGRLSLDGELAAASIDDKLASALNLSREESAAGAIQVVNAAMEGAIRVALRGRGDDPRDFALVAFGGGGALHACELARSLAVPTVIVPSHPGTLCAEGLLSSDIKLDASLSDVHVSTGTDLPSKVTEHFQSLEQELLESFRKMDDIDPAQISFDRFCDVRYLGQAYEVMVPVESVTSTVVDDIVRDFHGLHQKTFGFSDPGDACELVTFRVTAKVQFGIPQPRVATGRKSEPYGSRTVYELETGPQTAFVYRREDLAVGTVIDGPAIIDQLDTTVWLPSYTSAVVHESGSLIVTIQPDTESEFVAD